MKAWAVAATVVVAITAAAAHVTGATQVGTSPQAAVQQLLDAPRLPLVPATPGEVAQIRAATGPVAHCDNCGCILVPG